MAIFQGIRDSWADRKLERIKDVRRMRRITNLHEAKDVGVIYPSDSEAIHILVKQFMERLRGEYGIPKTLSLGFVPEKEAPNYHSHMLHTDYFTAADLNWFGKPSGHAVESFIEREFDILIDLSDGTIRPLRFVMQLSRAYFRIGRNGAPQGYDMGISLDSDTTLDGYLKQLDHFLSIINHHEERQRV